MSGRINFDKVKNGWNQLVDSFKGRSSDAAQGPAPGKVQRRHSAPVDSPSFPAPKVRTNSLPLTGMAPRSQNNLPSRPSTFAPHAGSAATGFPQPSVPHIVPSAMQNRIPLPTGGRPEQTASAPRRSSMGFPVNQPSDRPRPAPLQTTGPALQGRSGTAGNEPLTPDSPGHPNPASQPPRGQKRKPAPIRTSGLPLPNGAADMTPDSSGHAVQSFPSRFGFNPPAATGLHSPPESPVARPAKRQRLSPAATQQAGSAFGPVTAPYSPKNPLKHVHMSFDELPAGKDTLLDALIHLGGDGIAKKMGLPHASEVTPQAMRTHMASHLIQQLDTYYRLASQGGRSEASASATHLKQHPYLKPLLKAPAALVDMQDPENQMALLTALAPQDVEAFSRMSPERQTHLFNLVVPSGQKTEVSENLAGLAASAFDMKVSVLTRQTTDLDIQGSQGDLHKVLADGGRFIPARPPKPLFDEAMARRTRDVPDDGNCLLHSLIYQKRDVIASTLGVPPQEVTAQEVRHHMTTTLIDQLIQHHLNQLDEKPGDPATFRPNAALNEKFPYLENLHFNVQDAAPKEAEIDLKALGLSEEEIQLNRPPASEPSSPLPLMSPQEERDYHAILMATKPEGLEPKLTPEGILDFSDVVTRAVFDLAVGPANSGRCDMLTDIQKTNVFHLAKDKSWNHATGDLMSQLATTAFPLNVSVIDDQVTSESLGGKSHGTSDGEFVQVYLKNGHYVPVLTPEQAAQDDNPIDARTRERFGLMAE